MASKLLQMMLMQAAMCSSGGIAPSLTAKKYNPSNLPKALKSQPEQLHKFIIKGCEIEARNRKDAIIRYNHLKKGGNQ